MMKNEQLPADKQRMASRIKAGIQKMLAPALLRQRTFRVALIACIAAVLYWGLLASDRYVSEAHVIIQRADLSSGETVDFGALITGVPGSDLSDQRLLRDHMLSVDMLLKVDKELNLRAHFSDSRWDLISRMWSDDLELELFHRHYLSRVTIEHDESAGVLIVRTQAYEPELAHTIATTLVREGERYMNSLAQRLAQEQVRFLEGQVEARSQEALDTHDLLIAFQREHGLVSPQGTLENLVGVINKLEAQLSEFKTERSALLGYLSPDASSLVELDLQIGAIEKQILQEQARLTSGSGVSLNTLTSEYQRLQLIAEFAQDIYKTSLVALEKGRLEATRTLKKVSVLQSPTMPQYPLEPRRIYNIVVFVLVALLLAGVVQLLGAIIREHKD